MPKTLYGGTIQFCIILFFQMISFVAYFLYLEISYKFYDNMRTFGLFDQFNLTLKKSGVVQCLLPIKSLKFVDENRYWKKMYCEIGQTSHSRIDVGTNLFNFVQKTQSFMTLTFSNKVYPFR